MANKREDAVAWAEAYDSELKADDSRFERTVIVQHQDGALFVLRNAFLMDYQLTCPLWLVAFTEHNGFHVWHRDDLRYSEQFGNRIPIQAKT